MSWSIFSLIFLYALTSIAFAVDTYKNPHFTPEHDTIVHLFEWKWNDIAEECENFLGPKGFGGIQISPVQENVIIQSRPWWERYQPISYKFITRSGSEEELKNMLKRCNKAGVRIYVDIILNHMCADQSDQSVGVGGSKADPKLRAYYEVPYTKSDFNELCTVTNYDDAIQVRNCELFGLHDLNQGVENVREKIVGFMNKLIDFGVAGFRVDAAKHMWPGDLEIIYSRLHNLNINHGFKNESRPFIYHEVVHGGTISISEYNGLGVVTEFKYSTHLHDGMKGMDLLKWYRNLGEEWGLIKSSDALVFVDNHDTQRSSYMARSLTYKESKLYKMATAFMLAHTYGRPQIMSSFEVSNPGPPSDLNDNIKSPVFNNDGSCLDQWICEHRWRQIYNMVKFRNTVKDTTITEWWDNWNNQIAFSRGNAGFIAINADSYDLKSNIHTQLPPGTYCDVISGNIFNNTCTGKTVVVNSTGWAYVEVLLNEEDGVLAIHTNEMLKVD